LTELKRIKLPDSVPIVLVNAGLERIIKKPPLLKDFEAVFYLKSVQSGFLFRVFPEKWQAVSANGKAFKAATPWDKRPSTWDC